MQLDLGRGIEAGRTTPSNMPDEWFEGVVIIPQDNNFRQGRPYLGMVLAQGLSFKMLANGEAEKNYGMWRHLGGGLPFLAKSPERTAVLTELASRVEELSGYTPQQINDRERQLRDKFRHQESFPFPVSTAIRRPERTGPRNSWFIMFKAPEGEILVRPRLGWMERSHNREFIPAWYRTRLLLTDPARRLLDDVRKSFQDLQGDLEQAIIDISNVVITELELRRFLLEQQARDNALLAPVKTMIVSIEQLQTEDILHTTGRGGSLL